MNETDVKDDTSGKTLASFFTRPNMAYAGFLVAIICVGIGAGMYHLGAGLITGGLLLAVFSYLLGNE